MTTSKRRLAMRAAQERLSTLRNRKGALTLSSTEAVIMLTVSLALIGIVAAGIIWVLPWAQNTAAQSNLQTVHQAQQMYFAKTSSVPAYGTAKQLVDSGAILESDKPVAIKAKDDTFCIGTKSDAGVYMWMTSKSTDIKDGVSPGTVTSGGASTVCPTTAQIDTVVSAKTGIKSTSPTITP